MNSNKSGSKLHYGVLLMFLLIALLGVPVECSITVQEAKYQLHRAHLTIRLINMKMLANKDSLNIMLSNATALFKSIDNFSRMDSWIGWYVDAGWNIPLEFEQKFQELEKLVLELRALMEVDPFLEHGKYLDLEYQKPVLSARMQEYTNRLESIKAIRSKFEERTKFLRSHTNECKESIKNMLLDAWRWIKRFVELRTKPKIQQGFKESKDQESKVLDSQNKKSKNKKFFVYLSYGVYVVTAVICGSLLEHHVKKNFKKWKKGKKRISKKEPNLKKKIKNSHTKTVWGFQILSKVFSKTQFFKKVPFI